MHDAAEENSSGRPLSVLSHERVPQGEAEYISTNDELAGLVAHVREIGSFAFDTEFIGEESFYPRTCLVQLGTTERVALVDPFEVDLAPVHELLLDPSIIALVHDGAQDLEPVVRITGREPAGIVDTQIAGAFCDMPWPASLAKVVERFTGHVLVKGHAFTQWDQRPLTIVQQRYAADDVRYLPLVWEIVRAELSSRGTLDWVIAECDTRPRTAGGFDVDRQLKRVSRGKIGARAATVLRELLTVRYELASELDEPLRAVLSDESVGTIAKERPTSEQALARCRGVSRRTAETHGPRILAALERGHSKEPAPAPEHLTPVKESAEDKQRVDAIYAAMTLHCLARGIAPQLVTSRSDLAKWYVRTPNALLFAEGSWRSAAVGAWLESFLTDEEALTVRWRDGRPHPG